MSEQKEGQGPQIMSTTGVSESRYCGRETGKKVLVLHAHTSGVGSIGADGRVVIS